VDSWNRAVAGNPDLHQPLSFGHQCGYTGDEMLFRLIIGGLIGAGLGAIMGYFGRCSSGACPLTSTWWRGAIYGGSMGLLIAVSFLK